MTLLLYERIIFPIISEYPQHFLLLKNATHHSFQYYTTVHFCSVLKNLKALSHILLSYWGVPQHGKHYLVWKFDSLILASIFPWGCFLFTELFLSQITKLEMRRGFWAVDKWNVNQLLKLKGILVAFSAFILQIRKLKYWDSF